jgi:hypothetical protein
MLFGTYENPREWTHTCGFDPEKEERLWDMLRYRDVHTDPHQTLRQNAASPGEPHV